VEQNARMALELADRGYVIECGKIVAEGKAQDMLNSKDIKDAYFGVATKSRAPEAEEAD
jgi:branched-chain amino acid transport system ATP-binding protein